MIFSFIPWWSEKILDMISLLNLLRLVLWPSMWSVLENVPCAFDKNVCSVAFGWNVSVKFIWSHVPFKINVSLLIFHLDDLTIDENGILKSLTIILLLCISLFWVCWNLLSIFRCSIQCWVPSYLQVSYPLVGLTPLSLS